MGLAGRLFESPRAMSIARAALAEADRSPGPDAQPPPEGRNVGQRSSRSRICVLRLARVDVELGGSSRELALAIRKVVRTKARIKLPVRFNVLGRAAGRRSYGLLPAPPSSCPRAPWQDLQLASAAAARSGTARGLVPPAARTRASPPRDPARRSRCRGTPAELLASARRLRRFGPLGFSYRFTCRVELSTKITQISTELGPTPMALTGHQIGACSLLEILSLAGTDAVEHSRELFDPVPQARAPPAAGPPQQAARSSSASVEVGFRCAAR